MLQVMIMNIDMVLPLLCSILLVVLDSLFPVRDGRSSDIINGRVVAFRVILKLAAGISIVSLLRKLAIMNRCEFCALACCEPRDLITRGQVPLKGICRSWRSSISDEYFKLWAQVCLLFLVSSEFLCILYFC